MTSHRNVHSFVFLASSLMLSGCGLFGGTEEPPPPPAPTMVEMRIETSKDANPGTEGSGSPLLIRVYELKGPVNFKNADFFALYEMEDSALASDLIRKSEIVMRPGETRTLEFKADDATEFVGVFAAFRQLDTAQWRALAAVPPHRTTTVDVKVAGTQLKLESVQKTEPNPDEADD
ncbi:MAG: type secretion lipoprotein family [Proteobacteria bacterium]|nr:type secretion lipoprotein family [Pseudomonadota bacterium]